MVMLTSESGENLKAAPLKFGPGMQRLTLLLLILAFWYVASLWSPPYIIPGPVRVWHAFQRIVASGDLAKNIFVTFGRVLAGFGLAAVIGIPLGILLGANKAFGQFFEPILPVLNTVSSAIWAIFAVIWFGVSNATTIFVVFMTAMPLIITNTWQGTRSVQADFLEMAKTLRLPTWKVVSAVYMPSILPYVFSGARLAFGFGWRVSLVAETLGSSSGVGYKLEQASDLIQIDLVFAWTIVLIVLMASIEAFVLKPLETRLFRWQKRVEE